MKAEYLLPGDKVKEVRKNKQSEKEEVVLCEVAVVHILGDYPAVYKTFKNRINIMYADGTWVDKKMGEIVDVEGETKKQRI